MVFEVFSVYDRVSGEYCQPIFSKNRAAGIRHFNYLMQNSSMVANDCDLYFVGLWNSELGVFSCKESPEFVCRYEQKEVK